MKIDDYQCDGQMTLENLAEEVKKTEYGSRGCKACFWFGKKAEGCYWNDRYFVKNFGILTYPSCERFEPDPATIPRMCRSCKWSNQFKYEKKTEYAEELKKHNGYTRTAADDPVEEPNIYCEHPDGSLNRRTEYKDCEQEGFGVGHWDRQHEWDTCDRWVEDRGPYAWWNFGGEDNK
jgi:hypothetical protein